MHMQTHRNTRVHVLGIGIVLTLLFHKNLVFTQCTVDTFPLSSSLTATEGLHLETPLTHPGLQTGIEVVSQV